MLPLRCAQIYAIYDYQVKYAVRLATENPYVPTFGSDIPGGPPGLGVSSPKLCCAEKMLLQVVQQPCLWVALLHTMLSEQGHDRIDEGCHSSAPGDL